MPRIYEAMTRVLLAGHEVRVWTASVAHAKGPDLRVVLELQGLSAGASRLMISKAIERIAGVAAYEILDEHGNGEVVYLEWP